jgi:hypothetical protein
MAQALDESEHDPVHKVSSQSHKIVNDRHALEKRGVSLKVVRIYQQMSVPDQTAFMNHIVQLYDESKESPGGRFRNRREQGSYLCNKFFEQHQDLAQKYKYEPGMAIGGKVGEFMEPLPVKRDDPWQMGFDDAKSGRFDAKTLGKRRDRYFHELADANEYDKGVLEGEKDGHHEEWHRRIMKHRK